MSGRIITPRLAAGRGDGPAPGRRPPGAGTITDAIMLPTNAAAPPSPRVAGKFLQVGAERFLVKGVAYGTFAPDADVP